MILDFLIKKQEFKKVGIEECFIEWGGEQLSQEPKKYIYNSSLVFHENTDMSYYVDIVKNKLNAYEFTSLTLEGNQLQELNKQINNSGDTVYTHEIISFISILYRCLDTFCIVKLRDEECVDEIYVINEAPRAIHTFVKSLWRNSPKGIAIIKV